MEAVAAGNEVAIDAAMLAGMSIGDVRSITGKIVQRHVLRAIHHGSAQSLASFEEIARHLGLAIDGNSAPTSQTGQIQTMPPAREGNVQPFVDQSLCLQPTRHTRLAEKVNRALLEDAGADPPHDMRFRSPLEYDRFHSPQMQQLRQQQARRASSDDGDLYPHSCRNP